MDYGEEGSSDFSLQKQLRVLQKRAPFPRYYVAVVPARRNFNNEPSSQFMWDRTFMRNL